MARNMETIAGTAGQWSQRLVNSIAATEDDCVLFSLDVLMAAEKAMSFEEAVKLTDTPVRAARRD
eukprot:1519911-Karenia_brevis.AAC.1